MNHPLHWPNGWPRSAHQERSRFGGKRGMTIADGVNEVLHELNLLRASHVVISTNLEVRLDGLPRSNQRMPEDTGVAVYFKLNGGKRVLACDRWDRVEHNLRAVAKHIEALRGMDRWGVGTVEQAFTGYAALPEPGRRKPWSEVLGYDSDGVDGLTAEEVNDRYRDLSRRRHPDAGGSDEAFRDLTRARDEALKEVGA